MLVLSSFGFKYGVPHDANYVFDVRFVPNPFYVAELRLLTGMDEPVRQYLGSCEETGSFLASSMLFLKYVISRYFRTEREVLHVAVGCTGGRHRSVALVEWLGEHFRGEGISAGIGVDFAVELHHRDVGETPEP